jgi:hypothetical protein
MKKTVLLKTLKKIVIKILETVLNYFYVIA